MKPAITDKKVCWFTHDFTPWRRREVENTAWEDSPKAELYRECRVPDCGEFQVAKV